MVSVVAMSLLKYAQCYSLYLKQLIIQNCRTYGCCYQAWSAQRMELTPSEVALTANEMRFAHSNQIEALGEWWASAALNA